LGALALLTTTAHADNPLAVIARCAALESPVARLACYDAVAEKQGVAGGALTDTETPEGAGRWKLIAKTSPIDDSQNVTLLLAADEPIHSSWGTREPQLIARCQENKTEVYVAWDVFLGTDRVPVLERFDREPAHTRKWGTSTDHKAAFYPDSDVALLKKMLQHEKLLLQLTPYGESPVLASFDLQGLSAVLPTLQAACKWE